MSLSSVGNILQRGGTILLTSRSPEFMEKKYREQAFNNLKEKLDELKISKDVRIIIAGPDVFNHNHDCAVKALESKFVDIEDGFQYFIALLNKMDYIVSFDKSFQKYSSEKLPIINIDEYFRISGNK